MPDPSPISLLLIEDNPGDARLVREHLLEVSGAQQIQVHTAPTLAAGMEFSMVPGALDIVLLDLSLPDSFGLETLARWLTVAPGIPVIILTGSNDEALAVTAVREGAQDYLVKGQIDGALLLRAIRYAIERRRVQEALRLAYAELELRVAERTSELRDSNQRLEEEVAERTQAQQRAAELLEREQAARLEVEAANRSKDEFLAILSHELRTPLNAILGWVEILRDNGLTDPEVMEGIGVIERNARSQARLVEDVLEVSRIICGKIRLKLQPVEMEAVVTAALAGVRPAAAAKSIEISATFKDLDRRSSGDADRLQQVIWNLLANAIKFTPPGGRIMVQASQDADFTRIVVQDTGIGIQPDFLPYVFDRFRQSDASITRSHGGLGLGLSISRHLVEMHGGTISVVSGGEGRGSTFTVTLPLASPDSHPLPTQEEPKSEPLTAVSRANVTGLRNVQVLVLDDEADSRQVAARILQRAGAQVKEAASAREAREMLAEWQPDVLISDIAMPDEDGFRFLHGLRTSPLASWRSLPAIALSAFARPEDQAQALDVGFQSHLAKPFEPAALIAKVALLAGTGVSKERELK